MSHNCHAGGVANGDFKQYRSRKDSNSVRRKIESYSSEAKNRLNWSVREVNVSARLSSLEIIVHVFIFFLAHPRRFGDVPTFVFFGQFENIKEI